MKSRKMGVCGSEATRRTSRTWKRRANNNIVKMKCRGFAWLQTGLAITVKEQFKKEMLTWVEND